MPHTVVHPYEPSRSSALSGDAAAPPHADVRNELQETAALFYARGWAYGTSGNYSVVLQREPLTLLITASGRDKRQLGHDDFVLVDGNGRPVVPAAPISPNAAKPSAETLLHALLARRLAVGAVLHTHSVFNTLLSELHAERGALEIAGYEMLKGLAGIDTHATRVHVPIVENSQDMAALAEALEAAPFVRQPGPPHAFLLRGHGLYTWGRTLSEARRHVEILEFLFEVCARQATLAAM